MEACTGEFAASGLNCRCQQKDTANGVGLNSASENSAQSRYWTYTVDLWIATILLIVAAALLAGRVLKRRREPAEPGRGTESEAMESARHEPEPTAAQAPQASVSRGMASDSEPRPGNIVPVEILKLFEPLNLWTEEELAVLATDHPSLIFEADSFLYRRDEALPFGFYLLKGEVELVSGEGASLMLKAQDEQARFPLACGATTMTDCIARSTVEVLRLPRDMALASGMATKRHVTGIDIHAMDLPPILKGSSAFYVFCQSFESREVSLPTLPSVALKLRETLRSKDINLDEAARIVQIDPVTTAKLIQVANSPLYLAAQRIVTCHGAVVRLGLEATLNLVVSIGLRGLFRSKNAQINRLMNQIWHKSVQVSVLASVLAKELGSVEPDQALLAGLTYRIGAIPFLSFVDHLPPGHYTVDEIEAAIPLLAGPVGKLVLTEWDFAEQYLDLPLLADDWFADTGDRFGLADLLRLAVWHSYIGEPRSRSLPPIVALPSFAKLRRSALTPEFSLALLQKSKSQIDETSKLLAI